MYNKFTFLNTIGYISRYLGTINKILPIYKDLKPAIEKSHEFINKLKKINTNTQNRKNIEKITNNIPKFFI